MLFGSDNWAGAAPEISKSLEVNSQGYAAAYGDSELDKKVTRKFQEVFESECSVFFVGTGTAANSLAFALTMRPGGVAFCHSEAHLKESEGGGPEQISGGGRLCPVEGEFGKISAASLADAASLFPQKFNHLGQGTMVSITQTTEGGTYYTLEEMSQIAQIARDHDLALHMDGARFANGLVALNCTPAEMTWKSGVDMVSFGATKNGCWCAEALVIFNQKLARDAEFVRKRMGHLFSKARFISAQFDAYFQDGLWLKLARHSNSIGIKLMEVIEECPDTKPAWPSDTNQVFFIAKKNVAEKWLAAGAVFHPFPTPQSLKSTIESDEQLYRLVASYASTANDVEAFSGVING